MAIDIRPFNKKDLPEMMAIWNRVVSEGWAFPQVDTLTKESGLSFFKAQSFTGVAINEGEILGLYILHPNNIGRCGHISNASYAVKEGNRGKKIGESLVLNSLARAKEMGFRILQFNAVVANNTAALNLYKKLGFTQLGTIPEGFLSKNNEYMDIIPHFIPLK